MQKSVRATQTQRVPAVITATHSQSCLCVHGMKWQKKTLHYLQESHWLSGMHENKLQYSRCVYISHFALMIWITAVQSCCCVVLLYLVCAPSVLWCYQLWICFSQNGHVMWEYVKSVSGVCLTVNVLHLKELALICLLLKRPISKIKSWLISELTLGRQTGKVN